MTLPVKKWDLSDAGPLTRAYQVAELERQVVLMHYFHMSSRGEIAAFLELSPDQVAYRLRSARRLFKEHIAKMTENMPSDNELASAGQEAFLSIGDDNVHPELAHSVGLLREHISLGNVRKDGNGQNLLQHSLEVARLAESVAKHFDLDPVKARRAGLLHDMGKVLPEDGSIHPERGAQKAADLGEDAEVVEAIANHHERGERLSSTCFLLDISPLCFALCAADTLSADRFSENEPEVESEQLADHLVEFDRGGFHAHSYLFGSELRVLVRGEFADRREVALPRHRRRTGVQREGALSLTYANGSLREIRSPVAICATEYAVKQRRCTRGRRSPERGEAGWPSGRKDRCRPRSRLPSPSRSR